MTKLILSTGNIVSGGPSIIRKPGAYRSNLELTNSLRSNFRAAQEASEEDEEYYNSRNGSPADTGVSTNGHALINGTNISSNTLKINGVGRRRPPLAGWTQREGSTLYIPRVDWTIDGAEAAASATDAETGSLSSSGSTPTGSSSGGLQEEEEQYDTTVKLFFLPRLGSAAATDAATVAADRAQFAHEALDLVFQELGVTSIDLLVLSFPGMSFEGDCEWEADKINATQGNDDEEAATWAATAEIFHKEGKVRRLGVAEFGSAKLSRFVSRAAIAPAVDQINIRNCCHVPPPLTTLTKERKIELLVHTDCTDVLPSGTLRELLGQGLQGAGVLADGGEADEAAAADALRGDLTPQWVVKYTAVVRDRGVIENKGYFAGALLHDE
ncbi:glutamate-cysteine ligase modifier subunit [Ophiostoma piceae UAMH 11346]|uniref:GCS light chain n=1 Tax=Ophiostoma piceae (strain UAMH 11346) TaxID=1262450 RepID=S3D8S1_OPHP1|nr:glutamate-cysteine ligase modifier subunit [Ophiostoma piceae UAMH 11346]